MKKILVMAIILVIVASMVISTFAIDGIPPYDQNYSQGPEKNSGELNATKHDLIQAGQAGHSLYDNHTFTVPGVKGNAIPTVDGKCTDVEGYVDIEGFAEYLYIGTNPGTYTAEEFNAWYNEVAEMNLAMKYCWDGDYIYFYLEYTVNDYVCTANSAAELWKHPCVQLGLASQDALSPHDRSETLFGINSFTEMSMAGTVSGTFVPQSTKDYRGSFEMTDDGKYIVKHEIRANICEALSLTGNMQAGEILRTCIVIACTTRPGNSSAQRFISFGHGITGQESAKFPNHFINLMLGEGYEVDSYYTPTEEEKDLDYREGTSFFFHQVDNSNKFTSKDGTYRLSASNGVFSTDNQSARFTSDRYPAGLWSSGPVGSSHAVIRYRTTSSGMTLGLNFINKGMADAYGDIDSAQFIPDAVVYPVAETPIIADGEWHDAIFKLSDSPAFYSQILKTAIEISKGSIELESIKFYAWDPSDIYGVGEEYQGCWCSDCDADCPCAGECSEDLCDCTCVYSSGCSCYDCGADCPCGGKCDTDKCDCFCFIAVCPDEYCSCNECGDDCPCGEACVNGKCDCDCFDIKEPPLNVGCSCKKCDNSCPCGGECTKDLCSCKCFSSSKPSGGNTTDTDDDDDDNNNSGKTPLFAGCISSIASGAALMIVASVASGALLLKKKEN